MARFYANENVPEPVVAELRRLGHDAVTLPDRQVLEFATANGRAVVTLNRRHFVRLHLEHSTHAGIVVCTLDPDFAALARRIHDAAQSMPELTGQLVRVNRPF